MGVAGLIGVLLFFAGAFLLWQARSEVLDWLAEFFRIFRREFNRREAGLSRPSPGDSFAAGARELVASASSGHSQAPAGPRRIGTLRLVGALGLIFLGQILLILDLAL